MIRNSRKKFLLIPNAKVGANSFIKVCDAEVFDAVITDWDCVEDQIAALEDKGIQVIVVDEPNEWRIASQESDPGQLPQLEAICYGG